MINMRIAVIIAIAAFTAGSVFSPPVQEAIAAVIATDVQCTGCVGNGDIASSAVTTTKLSSNSVNGGKITDGTISAADLAADSVGASELKGVTKLLFASCSFTLPDNTVSLGGFPCAVTGARPGDHAIATFQSTWSCAGTPHLFSTAILDNDRVFLNYQYNTQCPGDQSRLDASVIVYHE